MKIEFNASLPAIQSAINVSGTNDGMRVKLDIPGSDVAQAIQLMLLSGRTFKVTITDEEQEGDYGRVKERVSKNVNG